MTDPDPPPPAGHPVAEALVLHAARAEVPEGAAVEAVPVEVHDDLEKHGERVYMTLCDTI